MSRSKIRETDNLRTLYLTRFFVEYFLLLRSKAKDAVASERSEREKRRADKGKQPAKDPWDVLLNPLGEGTSGTSADVPDAQNDAEGLGEEETEMYPFGLIGVMAQEDTIRWMQRRLNDSLDGKVRITCRLSLDGVLMILVTTDCLGGATGLHE
jgi:hypothetical protein